MFVETEARPAGEPAKVGTLRLSQAIRIGIPIMGKESHNNWMFCALSAAFAGVHGRAMTKNECDKVVLAPGNTADNIADAIGFPHKVCNEVNERHYLWREPAAKIADWLESQGL